MKLSELSTDRALDALCELTPYISNICTDERLMTALGEKLDVDENANTYALLMVFAGKIGEITPILLRTHRADVYGILSILNEKSVEDIAAQPFTDTFQQIREALQDSGLLSFFRSFARQGRKEQSLHSADSQDSE